VPAEERLRLDDDQRLTPIEELSQSDYHEAGHRWGALRFRLSFLVER